MDRRTFLETAGLGAIGATAGCNGLLAKGQSPPAPRGGPWPQATGSAGNTGGAPTPYFDTPVWTATLPDRPATPPVVASETVVVGTPAGHVHAFDLATGDERWRRQTAGVQGAPVVDDEFAVVPGDDGRLHRIALADGTPSDPLSVGTSLLSALTLSDGVVYAIAEPGTLVAVDTEDWRVDWSADLATRGVGKPAVADGQVVVSGQQRDGLGSLQVFDASGGSEQWRVTASKGFSQSAVHDGARILVAGGHRNRITSSPGEAAPDPAGVFWFDTGGEIRRTETLDPPIWGHCSVRYLGMHEGWTTVSGCNGLVAHTPDDAVWSTTLPQGIVTRPLRTPAGVLVGDAHGQFWLLRPGEETPVLAVGGIPATPAVLDQGMVVAAGERLYGVR